jgi:hypothetical protein
MRGPPRMKEAGNGAQVEARGQYTVGDDLAEFKRIDWQISLGVVSRKSLCRILKIGNSTLAAWVAAGKLTPFKPGTDQAFFRLDDVRAFLATGETFKGARKPRKARAS